MPPPFLVDAVPSPGFDPCTFRPERAAPTHFVQGGDEIDLGDRRFTVVDLPGHTPGSIGLVDHEERALISGDAVYDGGLIDTLPESDIETYLRTMDALRRLDVDVVYPGHGRPFDRARLRRSPSATCASAAAEASRGSRDAPSRRPLPGREQRHATQVSATPTYCTRESRSRSTTSPRDRHRAALRETTEAMATGPTVIAAASATKAAGVEDPGDGGAAGEPRGSRRPASSSATGTSTTMVPRRP